MQESRLTLALGSSRGAGAATAQRLNVDGWDVIHGRTPSTSLQKVAREIGGCSFAFDVSDVRSIGQGLFEIFNRAGVSRCAVYCCGINPVVTSEEMTPHDIQSVLNVNFMGAAWASQVYSHCWAKW